MDDAVKVITQLGFPIFVCLWFMWRDYKVMTSIQRAVDDAKEEVGKLNLLLETILKTKTSE